MNLIESRETLSCCCDASFSFVRVCLSLHTIISVCCMSIVLHKPYTIPQCHNRFPAKYNIVLKMRSHVFTGRFHTSTMVKAQEKDFDTILMETANKFENAKNKPAIVGWALAAFSAITVAEWLIHLPGLNFLLGFPVQFIGLIATGNLFLRYYVDKQGDPMTDIEELVNNVSKRLPGL